MEKLTLIETLTGIAMLLGVVGFGMIRAYRAHQREQSN